MSRSSPTAREVAKATGGEVVFDLRWLPFPTVLRDGYRQLREIVLRDFDAHRVAIPRDAQEVLRWLRDHFGEYRRGVGYRPMSAVEKNIRGLPPEAVGPEGDALCECGHARREHRHGYLCVAVTLFDGEPCRCEKFRPVNWRKSWAG